MSASQRTQRKSRTCRATRASDAESARSTPPSSLVVAARATSVGVASAETAAWFAGHFGLSGYFGFRIT